MNTDFHTLQTQIALAPMAGITDRPFRQLCRELGADTVASENAVRIARLAESSGIQRLAVHGRTRACGYGGEAEYDTIAEVKSRISIPVIANGDIDSPQKAAKVLHRTDADRLRIRANRAGQCDEQLRIVRHYFTQLRPLQPMELAA